MRLLNDELNPRALIATAVIPTWMKSTPFASLSALAKLLPTDWSICAVVMTVTVAGASVIFSTRRDADTVTPPSSRGACSSVASTRVSSPARTTTLGMVVGRWPMRWTRTS